MIKKTIATAVMASTLVACSATPSDTYSQRAEFERERTQKEMQAVLDETPEWMIKVPESTGAVYANGTAISSDISFADEKATLVALGKVCTAAGGTVDKSTKTFRSDIGEASAENSTMAIRGMCQKVDVTGAEVVEVKRIVQGTKFRTFVLVALPYGDANPLQKRKDQLRAQELVAIQAEAEFRKLDEVTAEQQ
jgi:hypothetical protein